MSTSVLLDEDTIDDILYLARVNEAVELSSYLANLATSTNRSAANVITTAVDPSTQNTALHYAAANGHHNILQLSLSLDWGRDTSPQTAARDLINASNNAGNTALHWAALNGHLECVKMLVQAGADVTIINAAGHDAVFEAEINEKREVVEWLLAAVEDLERGVGHMNGPTEHADAAGEAHEATDAVQEIQAKMEELNTDRSPVNGI